MNQENILDQFLTLEIEYDLFDVRVDGIPVWERIRLNTFRRVLKECNIINDAHDSLDNNPQTYLQALATFARSSVLGNPLLVDQHNFFFFGHPRRQIEDDGYWWDIYCDPIYDEVDLDYIHMSQNHKLRNYHPRKTRNYRNLDFVRLSAYALQKCRSLDPNLSSTVTQTLQTISAELDNRVGANIDLERIVEEKITERASLKPFYNKILDRVDPDVAVIVVSYGNNTFIEACHDREIPVVELQHGVVNKYHLGYSYPGSREKNVVPDYFFSWGNAWNDMIEFPFSGDSIIPVGYPYLEQRANNLQNIASDEMVLFISQGTIGEELSRLAVKFAKQNPKLSVFYKLHPGEYDRWRTMYPWLANAPLDVQDSNEPSLYELLARASYQVGVYSTAIYEGLFFGNETYIVDLYGAHRVEELLKQNDATLVSTANELTTKIESDTNSNQFEASNYFKPNATSQIKAKLNEILSEESKS